MEKWVVGIDLGGTKIRLGLVSPGDEITAVRQIPTDAQDGPAAVVARMAGAIDELKQHVPAREAVVGIGICSPGPVDHETGTLIDPPNLQGLHHTPLRDMLWAQTGLPVVLEHDAKAAALGDYYFGAGRGARDMVYVVVGTGVGAAIVVDGQLYRGAHNTAGEIGHTTLDRDGELCSCGAHGCVETYMSGPWLAKRYARARHANGDAGPVAQSGEEVARLAAAGNPLAREVMRAAGNALGAAIATMAMVLDIDLYVIGGSVAKAGDLLLEPARQAAPLHSFASVGSRIRIVPTALGDSGPILGCAYLARRASES